MPPVGGIPLDSLDPTSDIPSEFSRRASVFDHSPGIPDSGTRDRLSNPSGGPAYDLSRAFVGAFLGLQGTVEVVAIRFSARWARLFRRETLQHYTGVEFRAPRL